MKSKNKVVSIKKTRRFTIDYIDSYYKNNQPCKQDVFEGDEIGLNVGIPSTTCLCLVVESKREGDKTSFQKTIFIPYTFIKSLTIEDA